MKSLAVKYRPKKFSDVTEQGPVTQMLTNQIETNSVKNSYLFVGAAGTGKTTCARIFANAINKGKGKPIEIDAASNNSVDNVRQIAKASTMRSIDSEYKVYILDEVHQFSAGAWAAMLKLIEEPPAKTVFILCTTDYWKIPKTILSRCQRFDFSRITSQGIVKRLEKIIGWENEDLDDKITYDNSSLDYIARLSDGCMREAITTLDKCLSLSLSLSQTIVETASGGIPIEKFMSFTDILISKDQFSFYDVIEFVENQYALGTDMRQMISDYVEFIMDVIKYQITNSVEYTHLPETSHMNSWLKKLPMEKDSELDKLLSKLLTIQSEIKWSTNPKVVIEARLMV